MTNQRPAWQHEPCPPWCVTTHHEDDHPDDRQHQGLIHTIPGVKLVQTMLEDGTMCHHAEATTLFVVRHQYLGEQDEWITIGDEDEWIEVSAETAQRVREGLDCP